MISDAVHLHGGAVLARPGTGAGAAV